LRVLRRERVKDLLAVERVQARKSKKSSVPPGERRCSPWGNVEAPVKSPQCLQGREDVAPGQCRGASKKSSVPPGERRCSPWGNVEAAVKSPQCLQGREDVAPGAM